MFEVLKSHLPVPQTDVDHWISQSASERRHWFDQADLRTSAALLLLEQAAQRRQLLLAQDELKRKYLSSRALADGSSGDAGKTLEKILANSGFLSRPAELLDGGYGLPQAGEWQHLQQESDSPQAQLRQLRDALDDQVRGLLEPARLAELDANEANLKQLSAHLRALHKAGGGFVLP